MKHRTLVNAAFVLAAVGYAVMAVGCGPRTHDPAVAEAKDDPNWAFISPLPESDGFYKMYDYEDGRLCYLVMDRYNGRAIGTSLECQYNRDEKEQSSFPPVQEETVNMHVSFFRDIDKQRNKDPRKPVKPKPCLKWPYGLCPAPTAA